MPSELPEAAARWRALALEARITSDQMTDPEARLLILSIAQAYERLARRAEAQEGKKDSSDSAK
jgi:hypothetical protein